MIELTALQFKIMQKLAAQGEGEWKVLQGNEAKAGSRLVNPLFSGGSRYVERRPHPGNRSRTEYRLTVDGWARLKFELKRR